MAGVVGTKIPHYSVFGDTVEIAGLMESSGEPMKIQVYMHIELFIKMKQLNLNYQISHISMVNGATMRCLFCMRLRKSKSPDIKMPKISRLDNSLQMTGVTKDLLEKAGGFTYTKRDTTNEKMPMHIVTYWLLGQLSTDQSDNKVADKIVK